MPLVVPRRSLEELSKCNTPEEFTDLVFKKIDVDKIEVLLNRILTAVYIENEITPGGIIKPTETIAESIWQGKAALVLKVGPAAFEDDTSSSFYGQSVKPGDWVSFRAGNCSQIEISKIPCRIVEDRYIEAIYHDPRMVTS
jgi:co-chaperonin GroES (HSP10)